MMKRKILFFKLNYFSFESLQWQLNLLINIPLLIEFLCIRNRYRHMESSRFPLYSGEREVYQATDQSVVSPPDCQYIIQHTVQENLKNHELELQVCI